MFTTQPSTLDFVLGAPRLSPIPPIRYDEKGRQCQFFESDEQRTLRTEFLHKSEWAKRIARWVDGTDPDTHTPDISPPPLSLKPMPTPADISWLQSLAEGQDPDEEPYLFYSSGSSSSSPSSTSSSPSSSSSPLDDMPSLGPLTKLSPRASRRRVAHQRSMSLSAICEAPEEY